MKTLICLLLLSGTALAGKYEEIEKVKFIDRVKEVKVPVSKPVPYAVNQAVLYPVDVPYPITVEKQVPYKVIHEKEHIVPIHHAYSAVMKEKQPFYVEKKVPYPVEVPVKIPEPYKVEVPVPVPRPYVVKEIEEREVKVPVKVEKAVPYPKPEPYRVYLPKGYSDKLDTRLLDEHTSYPFKGHEGIEASHVDLHEKIGELDIHKKKEKR
uniref:Ootheca protein n=1 Tax=Tenodera australasiae TaxID=267140 RepID=I3PM81_9NEOP|nr:ootheca protein [Tenodera australasiae]